MDGTGRKASGDAPYQGLDADEDAQNFNAPARVRIRYSHGECPGDNYPLAHTLSELHT